jgi:hypothetical protein
MVTGAPQQPDAVDSGLSGGTRTGLAVIGLLVFAVLAGLTPLAVREARRRWRLHLVGVGGPDAVSARVGGGIG